MANWLKRLLGGSGSSQADAPEPATAPEPPSLPDEPDLGAADEGTDEPAGDEPA